MFRVLASCTGALLVCVIVGMLLWTTLKRETARQTTSRDATVSNGDGTTSPVEAFKTPDSLADYLLAAASHDAAAVTRLIHSPTAMAIDAGTKVRFEGYSGPGQAKITFVQGPHAGEHAYVSYAVIQQSDPAQAAVH